jgi:hypothetical protein
MVSFTDPEPIVNAARIIGIIGLPLGIPSNPDYALWTGFRERGRC